MSRLFILFRNDLRLHDNIILHKAADRIRSLRANEVLPVYCFDPRQFALNWLDFKERISAGPKTGLNRARFLLESVLDLKQSLQSIRSDLLIAIGHPEEILKNYLCPGENVVLMQKEVTYEEINVERSIRRCLIGKGRLDLNWGSTLFHPDDIPFEDSLRDFPSVPHGFLERVLQKAHPDMEVDVRNLFSDVQPNSLPLPQDTYIHEALKYIPSFSDLPLHDSIKVDNPPGLHSCTSFPFKGGETSGLERMRSYVWNKNGLSSYHEVRDSLMGVDFSSKLSPWLANGCLSPRRIFREIVTFEKRRRVNQATTQMKFSLGLRDWKKLVALKYGAKIFSEMGVLGAAELPTFHFKDDQAILQRWYDGVTGVPFADAILRELKQTGYISNRGRISVANFLTVDLNIDWRFGAAHFEQYLIDYDATSNWVNWLIAANLLNERNVHMRILKQSMELDPDGVYIKRWVPELKSLPKRWIHRPWLASSEELRGYGVVLGSDYPFPIQGKYLELGFV